jgi:RND family efflux transporter MFP subunit
MSQAMPHPHRSVRRRASWATSLAVIASLMAVCGAPATAQEKTQAPPSSTTITLPGQVAAYQAATLTARVAGYLKTISVDKGDRVEAGALLAELEVPELIADRAQHQAQADVARTDYERVRQAAASAPDLVTPQSVDEARGRLRVAEAQLQRTETLLSYARIVAPFAGVITDRYVDPGAFVPVASSSDQKSAAVVTLMDFSRVRVRVPVPESEASHIIPGTVAVVTGPSLGGRELSASVSRVSYALQAGANTMLAEVDLTNADDALRPGMYVSVRLTYGTVVAAAGPAPR